MDETAVDSAAPAGNSEYLSDAEIAALYERGVVGLVTRQLSHLNTAATIAAAALLRRDFAVATLTTQAEYYEGQAAYLERSAASRGPKARGHATMDLQKAEVSRSAAAKFRAALERL